MLLEYECMRDMGYFQTSKFPSGKLMSLLTSRSKQQIDKQRKQGIAYQGEQMLLLLLASSSLKVRNVVTSFVDISRPVVGAEWKCYQCAEIYDLSFTFKKIIYC